MEHTPGPWRFEQDGHEPYWNVDMPMQDGSPGYGYANAMVYTTEADARLIAAAPELLEVLDRCNNRWDDADEEDNPALGQAIRAAIAKATEKESE